MSDRMTIKDLERMKGAGLIRDYCYKGAEVVNPKKPKFGNVKTRIDGHVFDSAKEARRYIALRYLMMAGEITGLRLQVEYKLSVCKYVADFVYEKDGEMIVEDCKGFKTATYRLKKKLMKSELGIEIKET